MEDAVNSLRYSVWRLLTDLVYRLDFIGLTVSDDIEPPSTTRCMAPLLLKPTLCVFTIEQIVAPVFIGKLFWFFRPDNMSLTAVAELRLVTCAAPGTFNTQPSASFVNQDQCATPAAPCSSIKAPV